jgi:DNA (cytosine-5)-methyltransferase 1
MNYLSVCSGIEAATVAWHDMGWKAVGYSEIEKFPSQLLAHHYPNVTNYGDMTKFKEWNINESVNLLVGGTPCQSFSIAGLRKGLEDPRGNLMLTYLGILNEFRPKWCIWENVPGVLSSNKGRDFGTFLGAMVELGYGFAYRVLDAQNFGVAQRRRRVFVVGCVGDDWRSAAKVLFESESLRWDSEKSRSSRQETSREFIPSIANTIQTTCHDYSRADGFNMITQSIPIASAFKVRGGCEGGGKGYLGSDELAFTLSTMQDQQIAVSFNVNARPDEMKFENNLSGTLTSSQRSGFIKEMRVRKLTPMECERLQGFPDNYTNTPTSSDSTRYKALGNSMAVPVMKWIGERINNV